MGKSHKTQKGGSQRKQNKKKSGKDDTTESSSSSRMIWVDPARVRFQHSRIRPHFSGCGRGVVETLDDIRRGSLRPSELPPIQVIVGPPNEDNGGGPWYFSLNNRRLWVLKRCRDEGFFPTEKPRNGTTPPPLSTLRVQEDPGGEPPRWKDTATEPMVVSATTLAENLPMNSEDDEDDDDSDDSVYRPSNPFSALL
eukprot:CAMPEP_0168819060 /NCGR_PEP_ID=MMETSP0726-20121227/8089_1 /TAXON_ID=265536 /ORGANISM="Amphiprora sp., Strain CCMP467" /LENGTH=195 /DNA_ID=CAMNT_0008871429 /DNA_START=44 /DNA_END=631 /DNA_ORIENTATION=+